tara:strand:+ start:7120 stop:7335 length:216 start_codon:yes stop_codon:yes gene_type:complete
MKKVLDEIIQRLEEMDKRLDVIESLVERVVSYMQINETIFDVNSIEFMEEEIENFINFILHWNNEYRKDDD